MSKRIIQSALSLSVIALMAGAANAAELQESSSENKTESVKLETLVVTASGAGVDIRDAPASISVVTSDDLDRMPVTSLANILGELPGASGGYSDVGAGSKVSFRGMPSAYTLVLIDGKRIGNSSLLGHRPDKLSQDLNRISPDMIERIEVVRGSMSTLYGSEAMGGVINIITKKIPDRLGGSIRVDYKQPDGSDHGDTQHYSLNLSGPLSDALGFRLGGSLQKRAADEFTNGTGDHDNKNLSAHLDWKLNDIHSLYIDGTYGEEKNKPYDLLEETLLGEHFGADELVYYSAGLGYKGEYDSGLVTSADLYYNESHNKTPVAANPREGVEGADDTGKSTESVLDLKANKAVTLFGFEQDLTIGAQGKYETVYNNSNIGTIIEDVEGNAQDPEKKPNNYAWSIFAEDQIHLRDDFIVTLGGRVDKSEEYDAHFSPRIYGVYHPADAWTIKGGVSRSFRAPNLRESSGSSGTSSMGMGCTSLEALGYISGGCTMLGNPDLEPETSTSYEVGFGYAEDGYGVDMTYFLSDYKDMITNNFFGKIGEKWYTRSTNVDKARTSGLELSYKFPLTDYLRVTGNATYMIESENKETGKTLLQTPEFTTNLSLFWDVTDKLNLFAKVRYFGKQAFNDADLLAGQGNAAQELYFTDAYTTGAFGIDYTYNKSLSLRAGIENIGGDKVNKDKVDYGNPSPATYYAGFTTKF